MLQNERFERFLNGLSEKTAEKPRKIWTVLSGLSKKKTLKNRARFEWFLSSLSRKTTRKPLKSCAVFLDKPLKTVQILRGVWAVLFINRSKPLKPLILKQEFERNRLKKQLKLASKEANNRIHSREESVHGRFSNKTVEQFFNVPKFLKIFSRLKKRKNLIGEQSHAAHSSTARHNFF